MLLAYRAEPVCAPDALGGQRVARWRAMDEKESTMRMARLLTLGVCGLAGVLVLAGCGPDPKQLQIEAQAERINELMTENDDLRARLARCSNERDAARARVQSLEQENFDLLQQIRRSRQIPTEPTGPTGWTTRGEFSWIDVGSDFLFASGKATLTTEGRAKLSELARQIQQEFPDKMIWVVGHTDAEPIRATKHLYKDNLDLSLERGATVYRELMQLGISSQKMIAGGQGEYNPKVPNGPQGRAKENRRVSLWAVPPTPEGGVTESAVGTPTETFTPPTRVSDPTK